MTEAEHPEEATAEGTHQETDTKRSDDLGGPDAALGNSIENGMTGATDDPTPDPDLPTDA